MMISKDSATVVSVYNERCRLEPGVNAFSGKTSHSGVIARLDRQSIIHVQRLLDIARGDYGLRGQARWEGSGGQRGPHLSAAKLSAPLDDLNTPLDFADVALERLDVCDGA